MEPGGPPIIQSDDRTGRWLLTGLVGVTVVGLLAVIALVVIPAVGDDGDGGTDRPAEEGSATDDLGEPVGALPAGPANVPATTSPEAPPVTDPVVGDDLFGGDLPAAVAQLVDAAGGPTEVHGLNVYGDYAFLAYRDPAQPGNIDRRSWRASGVSDASPNPIDDRVTPETEAELFALAEVALDRIPELVADAPGRFDVPGGGEVSHIIIDRFLPFDPAINIRVYVRAADGRSGGGYVRYAADGTHLATVG